MFSKKNLISFGVCLLLTAIVFFSIKLVKSSFSYKFSFDSRRENANFDWSGPKEGERINLNNFKTKQGEQFPQLPKQSIILLSIVDPNCRMCRVSEDLITQIQSEAKSNQIYYFMVSFAPQESSEKYFEYAETLSKSDKVYLWQGEKDDLSSALQKMVVPSHLLINEEGLIIRCFPGSSTDKAIRSQMANQIITEMLAEKAKLQ